MEERIQKLCLAGTRTEARVASRMHFMAPKYGSTFFSKSSATVDLNFESMNLILLIRD